MAVFFGVCRWARIRHTNNFKMNTDRKLKQQYVPRSFSHSIAKSTPKALVIMAMLAQALVFLVAGCKTDLEPHSGVYTHPDFLFPSHTNVLDQADVISITIRY